MEARAKDIKARAVNITVFISQSLGLAGMF